MQKVLVISNGMDSEELPETEDNIEIVVKGLDFVGKRIVRHAEASHADFSAGELWMLRKLPHEFRLPGTDLDEALEIMSDLSSGLFYLRPHRRSVIVRLELEEDAVGLRLAHPEALS
jgi:hypothetical protein